jgi:hypothetical protein
MSDHKQKVSSNNYVQTSIIYTILTQCYTRTLEEGDLQTNLRQGFHSPVIPLPLLRGQFISSVMPRQPCKEIVTDSHVEMYCNTTKTVVLIPFVFPVHSAPSTFHYGSIKQEAAVEDTYIHVVIDACLPACLALIACLPCPGLPHCIALPTLPVLMPCLTSLPFLLLTSLPTWLASPACLPPCLAVCLDLPSYIAICACLPDLPCPLASQSSLPCPGSLPALHPCIALPALPCLPYLALLICTALTD